MDSLTQFALGAVVGELVLGKELGWKGVLLGGIAGTIPDLDVLLNGFFDPIARMKIHRGFSHSIFFSMIFGPLLGWISHQFYPKIPIQKWTLMWFLGFLTHTLLDCCTTYGTQLFNPVSDYLVAFDNIFVVDPLFTIPLLGGVIAALFYTPGSAARKRANYIGIALSSLYMIWTFAALNIATHQFKKSLDQQNISYDQLQVSPTVLNSFLWEGIAQTDTASYFGNYSVFDSREMVSFQKEARNTELIAPYKDAEAVQTALWFSTGYYIVREIGEDFYFYNTKFGALHLNEKLEFFFPFIVRPGKNGQAEFILNEEEPDTEIMKEGLKQLWERIWGL